MRSVWQAGARGARALWTKRASPGTNGGPLRQGARGHANVALRRNERIDGQFVERRAGLCRRIDLRQAVCCPGRLTCGDVNLRPNTMARTTQPSIAHGAIALAGLAGALAEVVWVAIFCSLTQLKGSVVLRQITASFFPASPDAVWAPALGLAIHLALGLAVAYAFALVVWYPATRRRGKHTTTVAAVLALAAVWCVNFLFVLPVVNSSFVELMPAGMTFASKLLFGMAMAATLNSAAASAIRRTSRGYAAA